MKKNKHKVFQIIFMLLFPIISIGQTMSININNLADEVYLSDTIFLQVKNSEDCDYVYKISMLSYIDNQWTTVVVNIFDNDRFLKGKHSIHLMRRIRANSIDSVEFLSLNHLNNIDSNIIGKYKFHLSFREYNKPDGTYYESDSREFYIKE